MTHLTQTRVRYQETDAMGVAYHANYLIWFEVARTEYMRIQGMPYKQWEELGYSLPVVEAGCRYLKPARYDDELQISAVLSLRGVTFRFDYEVRRAAELLTTGFTEHVCLNAAGRIDRAGSKRLAELVGAGEG